MIRKYLYIILGIVGYSLKSHDAIAQSIGTANKALSISFIENKGQWDSSIYFKSKNAHLDILLKKNAIAYFLLNANELSTANKHFHDKTDGIDTVHGHFIDLSICNANTKAKPSPVGEANNYYYNYFIGNKAEKWHSHVKSYHKIIYNNIYNGIDLLISSQAESALKFDWIVKPHGNPNDIVLDYQGATKYKIEYNELYVHHTLGYFKEKQPFAYQIIKGQRILVPVAYAIKNNKVCFEVEAYNKDYDLIIDPDLIFSSYSGSTEDNYGFTATYDSKGNLYAGGITTGGKGGTYPVTPGAFQNFFSGGNLEAPLNLACDITISKYSADGKQLLYATYLGGENNESPHSLVVDAADNLVILGTTKSGDFPTSDSAYSKTLKGGSDILLSKLSEDGTQLLGSSLIGGTDNDGLNSQGTNLHKFYADDFKGDVIIDKSNNIIVASCSRSRDFPITANIFGDSVTPNFLKGVVFKMNANCSQLIFSSALQGLSNNAIYSIDLNKNEDIFIAGGTTGDMAIPNAKNTYIGGTADGFFIKIKQDGSQILQARYFGTDAYDQIFGLELDKDENVYIVGHTEGTLNNTANAYFNNNGKQFISKISSDFNQVVFLSKFGSGRNTLDFTVNAFLLDDCGRLYVSGWGGIRGVGNTQGLPTTANAFKANTDGRDFYLLVLGNNAEKLLYGSFFGGNQTGDHVDGGTSRFDKKGYIYQSVCASCPDPDKPNTSFISDFPTTADAVFKTNSSPRCSNAAFKMKFTFKDAKINFSIDTCTLLVKLNSPTENIISYDWLFANGETSKAANPEIPLEWVNNKEVSLVINNFTPCVDTAKITINYTQEIKKVKIANVFTPNNDGINDYFLFDGLSSPCDKAEIVIYNRWGQEIYTLPSISFKWDGKNKDGQDVTEGVYFYIASFKKYGQEQKSLHGTITLMR